jgi:hypothetical protein
MRWRCHRKGIAGLQFRLASLMLEKGQGILLASNRRQLKKWKRR